MSQGILHGQKVAWPQEVREFVRRAWPDETAGQFDDRVQDYDAGGILGHAVARLHLPTVTDRSVSLSSE